MRILVCGDVVGKSGRRAITERLPELRAGLELDFVERSAKPVFPLDRCWVVSHDQEVVVRLLGGLAACARTIEDDPCSAVNSSYRITAIQENFLLVTREAVCFGGKHG